MKTGYSWLNSKEIKRLKQVLFDIFEAEPDFSEYALCINQKNKIFMISRDVGEIDLELLRINTIGLYFGELKDKEIRLSIEGTEIVAKTAKKNIVELDDEGAAKWFRGHDLKLEGSHKGFVIIKRGNDVLGCSKHKDGVLMNFTPKERRIRSVD